MPRIRTVKPDFFQHEELSALPIEAHMLAAGLLCYADDEGYFNANAGLVRAAVFPLRDCSHTIPGMFLHLSKVGYLRLGKTADGKSYGHITKFLDHQRVNKPYPSKIKDLQIVWDDSRNGVGMVEERSGLNGMEKELNRNGKYDGEVISTIKIEPPKPSALRAARASRIPEDFIPQEDHYLLAKELGLNCEMEFQKFRDHFLGAPGQRGLKLDWDATLRNWLRTSFDRGGSNGKQQVGKAAARAIDNRANILAGLGIGPLTGPSGTGVPARSPAGGSPRLVGDVQD